MSRHFVLTRLFSPGESHWENLVTAPWKAQVVEMRFFGGLSVEESAEVLVGMLPMTVMRDWRTAKAWLYRELSSEERR